MSKNIKIYNPDKSFWKYFSVILLASIFCLFVFKRVYVFENKKEIFSETKKVNNSINLPTLTTTPPPTITREPWVYKNESWTNYSNNNLGFSIKYPKRVGWVQGNWTYEEFSNDVGFGPIISKPGGYVWGVGVSYTRNIDELTKDVGRQFDDRSEKRYGVIINNLQAVLVVVTTSQYSDWISKRVYIPYEGRTYWVSNGANDHAEFDIFYNSFRIVK